MQKVDQGGNVVIVVIYCCQKIRGLHYVNKASGDSEEGHFIVFIVILSLARATPGTGNFIGHK